MPLEAIAFFSPPPLKHATALSRMLTTYLLYVVLSVIDETKRAPAKSISFRVSVWSPLLFRALWLRALSIHDSLVNSNTRRSIKRRTTGRRITIVLAYTIRVCVRTKGVCQTTRTCVLAPAVRQRRTGACVAKCQARLAANSTLKNSSRVKKKCRNIRVFSHFSLPSPVSIARNDCSYIYKYNENKRNKKTLADKSYGRRQRKSVKSECVRH